MPLPLAECFLLVVNLCDSYSGMAKFKKKRKVFIILVATGTVTYLIKPFCEHFSMVVLELTDDFCKHLATLLESEFLPFHFTIC